MAQVEITAWDVAEAIGAKYIDEDFSPKVQRYVYKFTFGSERLTIGDDTYVEDVEDAKSLAGSIIMNRLRSLLQN